MRRHPVFRALLLALALGFATSAARAEPPAVVTSIKPLHGLASAVLEGVGTPMLLVPGSASPHGYALKPSDARALAEADLVFWVGPELETFLRKPLAGAKNEGRSVALMDVPGMDVLDVRTLDAPEGDEHDHGMDHDHGHGVRDGHIWLDPANAKRIVHAMADRLVQVDPANAAVYRANTERAAARIDALDAELKALLSPVAGRPFLVFHDAYQYLEHRYGLHAAGVIALDPEHPPGAKHLRQLRNRIMASGLKCAFAEPQFPERLLQTVIEGTPARIGVLDPEGAAVPEGPDHYFGTMRAIASTLAGCLHQP